MSVQTDDTNVLDRADQVRDLYIERDNLSKEIFRIKGRMREIDRILTTLVSARSYGIPHSGVVHDMVEVMSEDSPMTLKEIVDAMVKNKKHPKKHTIRQYLSNLACFERVRNNHPLKHGIHGWICHKEMINQ